MKTKNTKRAAKELKPDDYIAPGMFVFCSRCGKNCREGDEDFMCISCASQFRGDKVDRFEVSRDIARSKTVEVVRRSVAKCLARYLEPKWWLEQDK